MNGRMALETLKMMEENGSIDNVLNVDLVDIQDVRDFADPLYAEYGLEEKAALDGLLADKNALKGMVEQVIKDDFPYGRAFIEEMRALLKSKVGEIVSGRAEAANQA